MDFGQKAISRFRTQLSDSGLEKTFQINGWYCSEDSSTEIVKYYKPEPGNVVTEIDYEGWRRHIPARRNDDEGMRFILNILGIKNAAKLSRELQKEDFSDLIDVEAIVTDHRKPLLEAVFSFVIREKAIENNAHYLDEIFKRISVIQNIPKEIINDLREVIACNCVKRFRSLLEANEPFEKCIESLRPSALTGVSSPYFLAAIICLEKRKFQFAQELLKRIHKDHWQFEDALNFKDLIHQQEKREMEDLYEQRILDLTKKIAELEKTDKDTKSTEQVEVRLLNTNLQSLDTSSLDISAEDMFDFEAALSEFSKKLLFKYKAESESPWQQAPQKDKPTLATVTYLNKRIVEPA